MHHKITITVNDLTFSGSKYLYKKCIYLDVFQCVGSFISQKYFKSNGVSNLVFLYQRYMCPPDPHPLPPASSPLGHPQIKP
jgi:hypothetical protein